MCSVLCVPTTSALILAYQGACLAVAAARLERQLLDRLFRGRRLVVRAFARVEEQDILGAHQRLEALLAALAVFPRLGLEAANHAHAAALMLGQAIPYFR